MPNSRHSQKFPVDLPVAGVLERRLFASQTARPTLVGHHGPEAELRAAEPAAPLRLRHAGLERPAGAPAPALRILAWLARVVFAGLLF